MTYRPTHIFATCQVGAEAALKREMARLWPDCRFSYSRPGFLTFRLHDDQTLAADFDLKCVFARAWGFCLGKVQGTDGAVMAAEAWTILAQTGEPIRQLHVFPRDEVPVGDRGFEPGVTPLCDFVGQLLVAQEKSASVRINRRVKSGQMVMDCVLVQPGEWWLGCHQASSTSTRHPGGMFHLRQPPHAVSRAYLKMKEALLWSQLPVASGDLCAEIGSSPGGSCQTLLDAGCQVIGIDPAEMHPDLLANERFRHARQRAADMKRREFRGVRWLMVDSNVAPGHTLDSVEAIVTHGEVHVRGMLMTLKLLNWEMSDEIEGYLERIRGWGFRYVRCRQLAHNRQEVCVAALRNRAIKRFRRQRREEPGK